MIHGPQQDPLVAAFDRLCRNQAERVLVASKDRQATVAEIDRQANRLAARLKGVGLEPGRIVGLSAPNGPAFLAALVALRRAGLVALLFDRSAPGSAIARTLERLGGSGSICASSAWLAGDDFEIRTASMGEGREVEGAVIKLTSGSTGEPRGILASSGALVADEAALTASMGIRQSDRLLAAIPFSHSYGLSSLVVPALSRGLPLILADTASPLGPLEAAREFEATVFPTVPAYASALLCMQAPPALPPSLRLVVSAGAPFRPERAREFRERFGQPIHAFYGASECGGITYDREGDAAETGAVGTPVEGVRLELEPLETSARDDAGRVVVLSPAVATCYLPNPDPSLADRRFLTQDLGVLREGRLTLTGRLGTWINVKGRKVNPLEVQRVIEELPGVDEVRVLALARGSSGDYVVQAVVACRVASLTAPRVVEWCRDRLSGFQVPRSVVLVDRMPLNERGKVDLDRLTRESADRSRRR